MKKPFMVRAVPSPSPMGMGIAGDGDGEGDGIRMRTRRQAVCVLSEFLEAFDMYMYPYRNLVLKKRQDKLVQGWVG